MSYEKKIKDLMARLAAMSPEPPPYPEEMQVARRQEPRKTRPVLVFATAVALVAVLAIPLLLFTGGEDPILVGSTTTTTTTSSTTSTTVPEEPSTTMPGTTTTTDSPSTTIGVETEWSSVMYLFQQPEGGFSGNPALIPVPTRVVDASGELEADDQFTEVLARIGSGLPPGLNNSIPAEVRILEVTVENVGGEATWVAEMNEAFVSGAGGLLADTTMLNQLVYTITQGTPEIEGVLFRVNGEPVEAFGSEGMVLTDPITRETFRDELSVIFLTEPLVESAGAYVVEGMSNTFEAGLVVNVLDGNGEVVHEEFIQATSGSGTWGTFSALIDAGLVEPGESSISVFQYSAEDGSRVDVVTVPVPAGGVWEFSIGA